MVCARDVEHLGGGETTAALRESVRGIGGRTGDSREGTTQSLVKLLRDKTEGERQLPNRASWKADAVGDLCNSSEKDGRPPEIEMVRDCLGSGRSPSVSIGVA